MSDYRASVSIQGIIGQLRDRIARLERGSIGPPVYTAATLPAATTVRAGTQVYVSDAAPGSKMQYSDGTAWQPLG
jgi:hypothetical protein